jgi:hypothetical protein
MAYIYCVKFNLNNMSGPVTSKYDNIYWSRFAMLIILTLGGTYLLICALFKVNNPDRTGFLMEGLMISAAAAGIYFLYFRKSPPRTIIISNEDITIDEYISRRHIVIKYKDIEHTRVFLQFSDSRFVIGGLSLEIIQIELFNGKIYRIYENDFENYEFLRNALKEHFLRSRQNIINV